MSDEICRRCSGTQQRRRHDGRSVQVPDGFMILHSSSRHLCMYRYVLRTTKYIRRKKLKEPPPGDQVSGWTCRICVQNFRVYLLKTAWTFKLLCGKHVYFTQLLEITWFQCRIEFLRYVLPNIEHRQVRSSNACVKRFTCSRLIQKKNEKQFFQRKRPTIFGLFDGLWSVGTRFRHYRQSYDLKKGGHVMSPSFTGGQYDTKYLVWNIRIDGANGIRGRGNLRRF